jgi:hypothetical protein
LAFANGRQTKVGTQNVYQCANVVLVREEVAETIAHFAEAIAHFAETIAHLAETSAHLAETSVEMAEASARLAEASERMADGVEDLAGRGAQVAEGVAHFAEASARGLMSVKHLPHQEGHRVPPQQVLLWAQCPSRSRGLFAPAFLCEPSRNERPDLQVYNDCAHRRP